MHHSGLVVTLQLGRYKSVDEEKLRPIVVVGPTASGKSALSLQLAHDFDGEVVNCDSMQLYRGMDIGTAKLTVEEREGIPHHQLDVWDITETASVARYQDDAVRDVEEIFVAWEKTDHRRRFHDVCAVISRRVGFSTY